MVLVRIFLFPNEPEFNRSLLASGCPELDAAPVASGRSEFEDAPVALWFNMVQGLADTVLHAWRCLQL